MQNISRIVFESVSSSTMRKTINAAYSALFEGLTPQQKTRRNIKQFLPAPPDGWDSPATDQDGNRIYTSENARGMTFAECLEYNARNIFFHDGGRSNPKFEPGVARIAYTELGLWPERLLDWRDSGTSPDWTKARELSRIVRSISDSHSADYDFDLNGMTFDELSARFAHGSAESGAVNDEADGTGCRYDVTWIPDFNTAKKYARFTEDTQTWCLTQDRSQWNRYMKGNTVKMYICTLPGFEDVPGVPGENCPLDEYGLSMLGVSINPDGSLDTCCTRWNHLHGGSDLAMDEKQLCKVLNVHKLSDVCPPYTEEEIAERTHGIINKLMAVVNGTDDMGGTATAEQVDNFRFPGIRMWKLNINSSELYIPVDGSGKPVMIYPLNRYEQFGYATLVGYFDPYAMESCSTDGDDGDNDSGNEYMAVYSSVAGRTKYLDEADSEDVTLGDIISGSTAPGTYDYDPEALIHGIALEMHVDFEGTYLFDTVKLDFDTDGGDGYVDAHAGNMFAKDNLVFLVKKDGIVNYGDYLASLVDPEYPRKSPSGRPIKWSADIRGTSSTCPNIGIYVYRDSTGGFFIVNPVDGKVIRKFEGVMSVDSPDWHRTKYPDSDIAKMHFDNEDELFVLMYDDNQVGVVSLTGKTVIAT